MERRRYRIGWSTVDCCFAKLLPHALRALLSRFAMASPISVLTTVATSAKSMSRQLSERLRQAINFVQRIESGERDISVAEFITIARAIGIDPCDLLRRALQ